MNAADRVIVALDFAEADEARTLVDRLAGRVGMYKVGSQLFTSAGPDFIRELVERGEKVFLDLKFHDIPHTVAAVVSSACRLGVSLLNVHALGGRAMMEAAVGALPAMSARLLAVTILTSHTAESLGELGLGVNMEAVVRRLAQLARDAGVDGVVCSPHEVALIRQTCGKQFVIVTPGIRHAGTPGDDQARAATAAAAVSAGADYIVVGRPITQAKDPAAAAEAVVREIESAQT